MNVTRINPIIFIIYYLILMVFAFIFNNPYYMITFGVLIGILIILQGAINELKTSIKAFIPICIFITLINTLFVKIGDTHINLIGS
ncbi:MAG: cobalt ABC transporter permease, partial [bacterium]|nr:cobalt ABC transporter permease [bacterium]